MNRHLLWLVVLALAAPVAAAPRQTGNPVENQAEMRRRVDQLHRLTPEERRLVWENFGAYQRLTPEERKFLHRNFLRWEGLPRERQEILRRNYRRFLRMSPEQRSRFLENYRQWRQLSPEERQRLRRLGRDPRLNPTPPLPPK